MFFITGANILRPAPVVENRRHVKPTSLPWLMQ